MRNNGTGSIGSAARGRYRRCAPRGPQCGRTGGSQWWEVGEFGVGRGVGIAVELAPVLTCPVLHVGGTDSGPWFAEVRELVLSWLPQAEDVVIAGAGHSLAATHPAEVVAGLVPFLRRHRIDGA